MAGLPKGLIENPGKNPDGPGAPAPAGRDVLSDVLRTIRLTGSLQFCFMPSGAWQTDDKPTMEKPSAHPSSTIPFHIVVEGVCWLKMEGGEIDLVAGDVVAFPFDSGHQLGAGSGGRLITPMTDLPPKPWRELPVLRYGAEGIGLRMLCGYLQCDTMSFRPLRNALPALLHARTSEAQDGGWLRATIGQIVAEVDNPRSGGLFMLERLTEITFIELLRHQIAAASPAATGWLAGLADPAVGRCLALIHDDPRREWSVQALSAESGLSRSSLAERFETTLGTSPIRYVREWRLCLASVALATTTRSIAGIAEDAGYGTEAAFSRAFSRIYGSPPAAWRQNARRGQTA